MAKRVLFWGRFDHGYSKTRVNIAVFRALGWDVDFFDVKWCCRFGDVEAFFRGLGRRPKPDLVFVPVCRQRDIAAACRWAHRRGIKVLFDPMISAWDKKVLEQKKWRAEESRAKRLLAWERKLFTMPDFITTKNTERDTLILKSYHSTDGTQDIEILSRSSVTYGNMHQTEVCRASMAG